jgi:murein DD-endopeptidase MepM/ murein hydrolase activator NlpD
MTSAVSRQTGVWSNFGSLSTFGTASQTMLAVRGLQTQFVLSQSLQQEQVWGRPMRVSAIKSSGYGGSVLEDSKHVGGFVARISYDHRAVSTTDAATRQAIAKPGWFTGVTAAPLTGFTSSTPEPVTKPKPKAKHKALTETKTSKAESFLASAQEEKRKDSLQPAEDRSISGMLAGAVGWLTSTLFGAPAMAATTDTSSRFGQPTQPAAVGGFFQTLWEGTRRWVNRAVDAVNGGYAGPEGGGAGPVTDWEKRITSHFGHRHSPKPGASSDHKGIDFSVPTGTPVKSMRNGRITFAGWAGGYGYLVAVDHGHGLTSRYAHNSALQVKVGDTVTAGQPISLSGSTGMSTGPHLHMEVRQNGVATNPLPFLRENEKLGREPAKATQPAPSSRHSGNGSAGGSLQWAELLNKAGARYGLSPRLLQAVMVQESGGGHWDRKGGIKTSYDAQGRLVGALGLMQVMPDMDASETRSGKPYKNYGYTKQELADPEFNIMAGAAILRRKILNARGNVAEGVRAYNGSGPGSYVYRDEVMNRYAAYMKSPKKSPVRPDVMGTIMAASSQHKVKVRGGVAGDRPAGEGGSLVLTTTRTVVVDREDGHGGHDDHAGATGGAVGAEATIDPDTKRLIIRATHVGGDPWKSVYVDDNFTPVEYAGLDDVRR